MIFGEIADFLSNDWQFYCSKYFLNQVTYGPKFWLLKQSFLNQDYVLNLSFLNRDWSALQFWKFDFEKLCWMNLIFCVFQTGFLQATQAVKIKFEIGTISSSSNWVFQTGFFKLEISEIKCRSTCREKSRKWQLSGKHWPETW